jgi:predicted DNA-binding transcriptional regulator AlpA
MSNPTPAAPTPLPERAAYRARDAAAVLSVSEATLWRIASDPESSLKPVHIGRAALWRRSDLLAYLESLRPAGKTK